MARVVTTTPIWRLLVAAATVTGLGLATPARATPAPIDRNGVLILVRTTLLALDDADKTGNYTAFRDLAAPSFAAANTAAKLGDIFASNRRDGIDLSGVAVLDPQLTVLPEIEDNGMMRMAGFFPSVPKQVNFELLYQPVNSQWRLFGIRVTVGPSGPVAPAPPAPPVVAATPKATKPDPKRKQVHASKSVAPPASTAATEAPAKPPESHEP